MKCKKHIACLLGFAMIIVAAFANYQTARAEDNGEAEYTVSFLDGVIDGNVVTFNMGGNSVRLTIDGENVIGDDGKAKLKMADTLRLEGFNPDTMTIKISAEDGFGTELSVSDGVTSLQNGGADHYPDGELKLQILNKNPQQGSGGTQFSGKAYFVWRGQNDEICFYKVEGLENSRHEEDENSQSFETIYINASNVIDQSQNNEEPQQYDIANRDYYWVWEDKIESVMGYENYSVFHAAMEADEGLRWELAIDPTGAVDGINSVCTNGDRNFRAMIYWEHDFEGLDFKTNREAYTYFPDFWDNMFYSNTLDISGSTIDEPAIYETFTLENKIHFSVNSHSVDPIQEINALGVPEGAVTIEKLSDGSFDITFHSNFFDNVIFELIPENGESGSLKEPYYIMIARTAIQVHDNMGPDREDTPKVTAKLYYDNTKNYEDFDVYAAIYYDDERFETIKLDVAEITEADTFEPEEPGTYWKEGGKNLKYSNYSVDISDDVIGVSFNVVKAGELSADTYSGSYLGSGSGVYYDIHERNIIY